MTLRSSGFSADWLALRERADAAARPPGIVEALRRIELRRAIDLGTGAGANFRYLSRRLDGIEDWLLVDSDHALLGEAAARHAGSKRPRVRCLRVELAAGLDELELERCDFVTAAALLDLVSSRWLEALAARCAAGAAAALFALSYDGRITWSPEDTDDERVRLLFNRHQRGDKGFGPALGPEAGVRAAACFARRGFRVEQHTSDWRLGATDAALQRALIVGYADAASEVAPHEAHLIRDWCSRRLAQVDGGSSEAVVGHVDVLAWRT